MLHLKSSHHFHLPHMVSQRPTLSAVRSEDDELIQDIEQSAEQPWELVEVPDVEQLDQFWTGVEDDLKKDPSWFSFSND
jgi:hypothetical protein